MISVFFAQIIKNGDLALPQVAADDSALKSFLQVVFSVVAVLCVIYITYAGFKFVTSQGDAGGVEKARNAIIYGVIGLIITLAAFGLTGFVLETIR
jgi:threonine/homoserine/homoserine lactone efflux protein